jgi:hypothetical protein
MWRAATQGGLDLIMLNKLSIIGAVVAVVLMIPTTLAAQMGGAINPGVHVGGTINPGATVRGAVERGIPGPDLGTWRSPSEPDLLRPGELLVRFPPPKKISR